MSDWKMYEEYMKLRKDQRALDVLNKLFEATVADPQGVYTLRYRADNAKDIPLLNDLLRYSFIEDKDQRYRLNFISIVYLANINSQAAKIIENCEKIYNVSKHHYQKNLLEPISLDDFAKQTGIPHDHLVIAMRYISGAHLFGGRPTGFPDSEDKSVTISEGILHEHENFQELVDQQKNWFPPIRLEEISSPKVLPSAVNIVVRALAEARSLEEQGNAASAVDRVHTAFHAYLIEVCKDFDIEVAEKDPSSSSLFSLIKKNHPAFQEKGPRAADVERMIRSVATTVDSSAIIRNKASLAHANGLLDEPEARAVINSIYTVFRYMQDCLARYEEYRHS